MRKIASVFIISTIFMTGVLLCTKLVFNNIPPQQFYSDDDILAAAFAGEISLVYTSEVYKCPVIGKKPK